MSAANQQLSCPVCGQPHRAPELRRGFSAVCVRCGTVISRQLRLGAGSPFALALAGLILFVPATFLPLVTVGKFGDDHYARLLDGVTGLWRYDMSVLGALVFLCSMAVPLVLLMVLLLLAWRRRDDAAARPGGLEWLAHQLEHWSMPEVQVLGVLVSFFKLGDVVDARVGPGLWCYGVMAVLCLMAWRGFELRPGTVSA